MKNLISIKDLGIEEIEKIFSLAKQIKKNPQKFSRSLQRKSFALIFHKPSLRTRVSFEVGVFQMGGKTIYLEQEIGFSQRESIKDSAMTLSRYVDGVIIRTFSHQLLLDFVQHSSIAVINALTDLLHPCQALSDLWTIKEKKGDLKEVKIAYIGDGNNVCNSLIYGCAKTETRLNVATP
ncbi:MAG: ornithine carbamoyltransferase, partial [Candidatus Omnitrophica bacterium]|nr:ornithine carbamoyltransferase [Candidatus Omnitrophota bacterium]